MNSSKELHLPPEWATLLAPGLVLGVLGGILAASKFLALETPTNTYLESALVLSSVIMLRSLLQGALQALDMNSNVRSGGLLEQLANIQVPMVVAGLLVSFSVCVFSTHLPADLQHSLFAVMGTLTFLSITSSDKNKDRWGMLATLAAILIGIVVLVGIGERIGCMDCFRAPMRAWKLGMH